MKPMPETLRAPRAEPERTPSEGERGPRKFHERHAAYHRVTHILIIISFVGLVLTGMPIKFSEAGWSHVLFELLGGFEACRFLHRFFAVVTFFYFGMHLRFVYKVARTMGWKRIVWGPNSMVPQPRDFVEMWQHFRWFLGLGKRPKFERFTYWEKFDYWAVFWGVAVIGSTGLIMWFPELSARVLPGWSFNLALIVHSEEALLAAGFIFTIHFFNTHLRPGKFPFDGSIFTGRVTREELAEDHPAQYERLVQTNRLAVWEVGPAPDWVVRSAKSIGYSALIIGICVIVFMFYSLLFHH